MTYEAHSTFGAELGAPDRGRYRSTPPGQPTVPCLVAVGMEIRTSYGTGGIVLEIAGPYTFKADDGRTFPWFTVVYVPADKWGRHQPRDRGWINECVAVDGRVLMLFEANQDEIEVVNQSPRWRENKVGQLALF